MRNEQKVQKKFIGTENKTLLVYFKLRLLVTIRTVNHKCSFKFYFNCETSARLQVFK